MWSSIAEARVDWGWLKDVLAGRIVQGQGNYRALFDTQSEDDGYCKICNSRARAMAWVRLFTPNLP